MVEGWETNEYSISDMSVVGGKEREQNLGGCSREEVNKKSNGVLMK